MPKPRTRGVHHLALNTEDMAMTLAFYDVPDGATGMAR